eukprot:CAMPEP_0204301674 /NCGR_PEP_ID=MMETSP0468-20130131/80817_1 /ASSEMBLY_ACC=CAM_ASM_000383 /TAXON_ID=2969 /ORGANISM="Oxyrrhis marina" /LENGTH=50 /DNA_ID=CAMNT_0051280833 /DNA_START=223 /DNA_END=372 /DNA_ORIENTATION=+
MTNQLCQHSRVHRIRKADPPFFLFGDSCTELVEIQFMKHVEELWVAAPML